MKGPGSYFSIDIVSISMWKWLESKQKSDILIKRLADLDTSQWDVVFAHAVAVCKYRIVI